MLKALELAARRLGNLVNEVVFVGGCTTALFITDPLVLDVRATADVDCIIDVVTLGQYYQFEPKLKAQGFKKFVEDEVICRFIKDISGACEYKMGEAKGLSKTLRKLLVGHADKMEKLILGAS